MEKRGWWSVHFDLTLDGEEIRWEDLDECLQEHILDCIKDDYFSGEIVVNTEYCYDGETINCPDCGEEITIEFDTARCESCGWSASDSELDEIMEV